MGYGERTLIEDVFLVFEFIQDRNFCGVVRFFFSLCGGLGRVEF